MLSRLLLLYFLPSVRCGPCFLPLLQPPKGRRIIAYNKFGSTYCMFAVPIRGPLGKLSTDVWNLRVNIVRYGQWSRNLTMTTLIYGTENDFRGEEFGHKTRTDFGICTQKNENGLNFGLSFVKTIVAYSDGNAPRKGFGSRIFFVCCQNCTSLHKSARKLIIFLRSHYFAMSVLNIRYQVKYVPPQGNGTGGYLEYYSLPDNVASALNMPQKFVGCETTDYVPVAPFLSRGICQLYLDKGIASRLIGDELFMGDQVGNGIVHLGMAYPEMSGSVPESIIQHTLASNCACYYTSKFVRLQPNSSEGIHIYKARCFYRSEVSVCRKLFVKKKNEIYCAIGNDQTGNYTFMVTEKKPQKMSGRFCSYEAFGRNSGYDKRIIRRILNKTENFDGNNGSYERWRYIFLLLFQAKKIPLFTIRSANGKPLDCPFGNSDIPTSYSFICQEDLCNFPPTIDFVWNYSIAAINRGFPSIIYYFIDNANVVCYDPKFRSCFGFYDPQKGILVNLIEATNGFFVGNGLSTLLEDRCRFIEFWLLDGVQCETTKPPLPDVTYLPWTLFTCSFDLSTEPKLLDYRKIISEKYQMYNSPAMLKSLKSVSKGIFFLLKQSKNFHKTRL